MCGRYVSPSEAAVERLWHLTRNTPALFEVQYNAAPTQQLPVYRIHPERGPEVVLLRWGLVPSWAKDITVGVKMINARADTLAEKPAFRAAFRRRRCLVPMMGFYEWQKTATGKVPHFIHLPDNAVFAAAGLHEWWPGKDGAAPVETYTIITTEANERLAPLHERMPVILPEHAHAQWLDPLNENVEELQRLLVPYAAEEMRAYPVSTKVNSTRNEGPGLIEEEAAEPELKLQN